MTLKDEFLMFWIFCVVVIAFVVRHFFGEAIYLVQHLAAFTVVFSRLWQ
ncbi:MAG: hypothetical protein WCE61_07875 [Candidatus Acidiferrum sp.]